MERYDRGDLLLYRWPGLAPLGLQAGTTCRRDARGGAFDLSRALPRRDEEARLCAALGLPAEAFTAGQQTHGCVSRLLPGEAHLGLDGVDALILSAPGPLGVVLTADCLPVILFDRAGGIGAVIHAGWRGVAGGIVPRTLERMVRELGCSLREIWAACGPAIGPCCYQVDRPVHRGITGPFPETAPAFLPDGEGRWRLSLEEAVRRQLRERGIPFSRIAPGELCTCCCDDFFSWRGEGGETGRMGTFLSLPG